jgi:hypothetical protein
MRPIAPRIVDRDDRWITLRNRVQIKILRFRSEVRRPLWSTSVNVQTYIVGRPGLDPGTLGLKETFRWLCGVVLVENPSCFQGNGVISCRFGFAVLQKYEAYNEACFGPVASTTTSSTTMP